MQYHFHLIRNILKLPYCFPLEAPSAPRSDNQAGGSQGPSVLGQARAAERKGERGTCRSCHHPLLSSRNYSWQDSSVLARAGERSPRPRQRGT